MQNPNSFDRIVHYMKGLADAPFKYGSELITPNETLQVTQTALRSYTCPEGCGGCCMKCSLIFHVSDHKVTELPGIPADHPILQKVVETEIFINDVPFYIYEDTQDDHDGDKCRYLSPTGRCGIYEHRPLPCRIKLFKFSHRDAIGKSYARVTKPGRSWQLKRVDGERGALCTIIPYDAQQTATHIRDLNIIKGWMEMMGISHRVDSLVDYLSLGDQSVKKEEQKTTVEDFFK